MMLLFHCLVSSFYSLVLNFIAKLHFLSSHSIGFLVVHVSCIKFLSSYWSTLYGELKYIQSTRPIKDFEPVMISSEIQGMEPPLVRFLIILGGGDSAPSKFLH